MSWALFDIFGLMGDQGDGRNHKEIKPSSPPLKLWQSALCSPSYTFLKLLVELKSFKIFTKLMKKTLWAPFGTLLKSPASSYLREGRFNLRSSSSRILFEGSLTIERSIPSRLVGFPNGLRNSSEERTLVEQRTLAQLLSVVLVVGNLLELLLLDCIVLVLRVHIKLFCPCLALQTQIVLNEFLHSN